MALGFGWSWSGPFSFVKKDGKQLELLSMDAGEWEHILREELRMEAWRAAAARRADMQGIEAGVQREITTRLLEWGKLTPQEEGMLRAILAGAVWTTDRLHRAKLATSPICPHCCTGAVEDQEHLWWKCPAWQCIREMYAEAIALDSSALPACMRCCGIMPATGTDDTRTWHKPCQGGTPTRAVEVIDLTGSTPAEEEAAARSGPYSELTIDGRVVVYTDGAVRNNQSKMLRYGGFGAFWGPNHPFNLSMPLSGDDHTNNKAELHAVVQVLLIEVRPVEVRTDSQYVHEGVCLHRARWRRNMWAKKGRKIPNADLWRQLDELLEAREPQSVKMTKVRGHIAAQDVLQGQASLQDKQGNDAADALAVAGAFRSQRRGASQELQQQLHTTIEVQRMMLAILQCRSQKQAEALEYSDTSRSGRTDGHLSDSSSKSRNNSSSNTSSCSSGPGSISSMHAANLRRHPRSRGRAAPAAAE